MEPRVIDGNVYLPIDTQQQREHVAAAAAVLAEEQALLNKVEQAERELVGTVEDPDEGFIRLVEFDAQRLDAEFEKRYQAWDGMTPRKFELYPIEDGYGNCLHSELNKPAYDRNRRALQFSLKTPTNRMPSFCTLQSSPGTGGGNSKPMSGGFHPMLAMQTHRISFDMEFSSNYPDQFQRIIDSTERRHATFWQFKNTANSWFKNMVVACMWDHEKGADRLMVKVTGDSRETYKPEKDREQLTIVRAIPMQPGTRRRWDLTLRFDPTGQNAITKIKLDGETLVDTNLVNCVPVNKDWIDLAKYGVIRNYIGGYNSRYPYMVLPEDVSVWFSNYSHDVRVDE